MMKTRKQTDERLRLVGYKAGYYGFLVTFPLMVLSFLVVILDFRNHTEYSGLGMLATMWAGGATFMLYLVTHRHGRDMRELIWRKPEEMKAGIRKLPGLIPSTLAIFTLTDYIRVTFFEGKKWVFTDRIGDILIQFFIFALIGFIIFRKPRKVKEAEHAEG